MKTVLKANILPTFFISKSWPYGKNYSLLKERAEWSELYVGGHVWSGCWTHNLSRFDF